MAVGAVVGSIRFMPDPSVTNRMLFHGLRHFSPSPALQPILAALLPFVRSCVGSFEDREVFMCVRGAPDQGLETSAR